MNTKNDRSWLKAFKIFAEGDSLWMKALKLFAAPFVILVMLYWQPAKYLSRKAYGGKWSHALVSGLIGLAAAIAAAVYTSGVLSVGMGYAFLWSATGALAAFLFVGGIGWPVSYLAVFKPLWELGGKFLRATDKFARQVAKPFFAGLTSIGRKAPFAGFLWENVEASPVAPDSEPSSAKKPISRWATGALGGLLVIANLALGAYIGVAVFNWLLAAIPVVLLSYFVNQALAGLLAATAVTLVCVPLFQIESEGKGGFVVTVVSAAATWAAVHFAGLPLIYSPLVLIGSFFYGVPGLITLAQGGLVKAFFKAWGRLLDAVYDDEKNKDFQRFFHNLMNFVVAGIAGVAAHVVAGLIGLPTILAALVTIIAALYSYVEALRTSIGKSSGTPVIAVVSSLGAGAAVWFGLPYFAAVSAPWTAAAAVASVFATGFVFFPVFYLVVRALGVAAGVDGLWLDGLRTRATTVWAGMRARVRKLQRAAFDDTTPFSQMFGHLINIGVMAAVLLKALPLAVGYVHLSFWLITALAVFLAINMFMLLGKLFSRYGAETLALFAGVSSGLGGAHFAWIASGGNIYATVSVGLVLAGFVGGILAPVTYLVARRITDSWLTFWLAPLLNKSFDYLWDRYEDFWRLFARLYRFVSKIWRSVWGFIKSIIGPVFSFIWSIVGPILATIGSLIKPMALAAASVWNAILGVFGKK